MGIHFLLVVPLVTDVTLTSVMSEQFACIIPVAYHEQTRSPTTGEKRIHHTANGSNLLFSIKKDFAVYAGCFKKVIPYCFINK